MTDLATFRLCYLASPFAKYPHGLSDAHVAACKMAGRLLKVGIKIYSPIAHSYFISLLSNIDPTDHSIWLPFEERMMALADCLIVAKMTGWQESFGIAHEIKFFESAGKPVFYLDTTSLEFTTRSDDDHPRARDEAESIVMPP